MRKNNFTKIERIISAAKKGEMYILVDDENRENEGDLVVPASNITAKKINFMAKYGRGLICLSLTDKQAKKLNLSLMSPVNKSRNQTAFTISIEARRGVTTGISAKDRYTTIKTAIKNSLSLVLIELFIEIIHSGVIKVVSIINNIDIPSIPTL